MTCYSVQPDDPMLPTCAKCFARTDPHLTADVLNEKLKQKVDGTGPFLKEK